MLEQYEEIMELKRQQKRKDEEELRDLRREQELERRKKEGITYTDDLAEDSSDTDSEIVFTDAKANQINTAAVTKQNNKGAKKQKKGKQ